MKKVLVMFFLVSMSFFLYFFCTKQTDGFQVVKIKNSPSFNAEWEIEISKEDEVLKALEQPFYYLAKGRRCYAFASKDDKYVLKFVRTFQITPPLWSRLRLCNYLFPVACEKAFLKKESLRIQTFSSYKIGIENLKEQTGTLFIQLNPKDNLKKEITFYDKIGIKHVQSAEKFVFILQKKAEPFFLYFKNLIENNKEKEAKELLSQLAYLLKDRADRKIADWDLSPQNLGISNGKWVAFDLDGLKHIPPENFSFKDHMRRSGKRIIKTLKIMNLDLAQFFIDEIEFLIKKNESVNCGSWEE
jgi:hypothetical protein